MCNCISSRFLHIFLCTWLVPCFTNPLFLPFISYLPSDVFSCGHYFDNYIVQMCEASAAVYICTLIKVELCQFSIKILFVVLFHIWPSGTTFYPCTSGCDLWICREPIIYNHPPSVGSIYPLSIYIFHQDIFSRIVGMIYTILTKASNCVQCSKLFDFISIRISKCIFSIPVPEGRTETVQLTFIPQ